MIDLSITQSVTNPFLLQSGDKMERIRENGGKSEIYESYAVIGRPVLLARPALYRPPLREIHLRINGPNRNAST